MIVLLNVALHWRVQDVRQLEQTRPLSAGQVVIENRWMDPTHYTTLTFQTVLVYRSTIIIFSGQKRGMHWPTASVTCKILFRFVGQTQWKKTAACKNCSVFSDVVHTIWRCRKCAQLVTHVCWLSSRVQQGCCQLPWIEPVSPWNDVCNNGLESATSVIVLQHKVMAADKWRHNEPWDHITLGAFRLSSMKRAVPLVRTVIYPPRMVNPNNNFALTCTYRQPGMGSLAHVYVFGLSTWCTLGVKQTTHKKTEVWGLFATFLLRNNTADYCNFLPHEVLTWDWVIVGSN